MSGFSGFAGYHSYGAPSGLDAESLGNPHAQYDVYGSSPLAKLPLSKPRKRLNLVAVCLNLFVPWLLFILVLSLLSFSLHYSAPSACNAIVIVLYVVLGLGVAALLADLSRRWYTGIQSFTSWSWLLFLCVTSLMAVLIAVALGDYNYRSNSETYFDLSSLQSYKDLDPSKVKGQEVMDAGEVAFAAGTHVDLTKGVGFRNGDIYCVAPITISIGRGDSTVVNTPLAIYDFWAVGKNCCPSQQNGTVDFNCGAAQSVSALSGLRWTMEVDRAFYRLAVQQAQTNFQIKAVHPLFFRWVEDAFDGRAATRIQSYQFCLAAVFAYFGFQGLLVWIASACFSIFRQLTK